MRKIVVSITILGVATLAGIVFSRKISGTISGQSLVVAIFPTGQKLHKATLSIDGMWCASCAVGAQYSLKSLEGVTDAYVGFGKNLDGEGWVVYTPSKITEEQIIKAVEPYKAIIVSDVVYNGKQ